MSVFLVFAVGCLLGLLVGAVVSVRLVRAELTANILPTLELLNIRLAHVQTRIEQTDPVNWTIGGTRREDPHH